MIEQMIRRVVLCTMLGGCIPVPFVLELPNRTELVKTAPKFATPEPERCTLDHMAEYLIWFDDDMVKKAECYGTLNETVYCLQLFPCLEQRARCEYDLERLEKCVNAGLERYSIRRAQSL